ncbi:ABC transporter substrate-binding protein [Treponema sp.]
MHKKLSVFVLVAAMAVIAVPAMFAGGAKDTGPKQITVGFAQIKEASSWRTAETNSVQAEAQKLGVNLKLSVGVQADQIAAIRDFIAQKVDGILLAPQTTSGWDEVLKEAKAAKIPVVLLDRGLDSSPDLYVTQVSSDFVFEGKEAAKWVGKALNGKGTVVELFGDPAADPAKLRNKGFMEGLKDFPGIKVIESKTGEWSRDKGKQVVEAWLAAGIRANVVFAHNDDMALGAIDALKAAGIKPGKDVLLISIDGIKSAFDAIDRGELNCTVECNPLLGPLGFDSLFRAMKGETLPKWIQQVDNVYDTTNYKTVYASRQY